LYKTILYFANQKNSCFIYSYIKIHHKILTICTNCCNINKHSN